MSPTTSSLALLPCMARPWAPTSFAARCGGETVFPALSTAPPQPWFFRNGWNLVRVVWRVVCGATLAVFYAQNFHPLGDLSVRFRNLPIWKQLAAIGLAGALRVYIGVKPAVSGYQPPASAASHQSDTIEAPSAALSCATALPAQTTRTLTVADFAFGFVMYRVGMEEGFDAFTPSNALSVQAGALLVRHTIGFTSRARSGCFKWAPTTAAASGFSPLARLRRLLPALASCRRSSGHYLTRTAAQGNSDMR